MTLPTLSQADCHINNLYNTTFWSLVQRGDLSNHEAEQRLKGTVSSDKNEILFSQFGINYNNEPQQFRKGTVIYKKKVEIPIEEEEEEEGEEDAGRRRWSKETKHSRPGTKLRWTAIEETRDIIGDEFWQENPHLLGVEET